MDVIDGPSKLKNTSIKININIKKSQANNSQIQKNITKKIDAKPDKKSVIKSVETPFKQLKKYLDSKGEDSDDDPFSDSDLLENLPSKLANKKTENEASRNKKPKNIKT